MNTAQITYIEVIFSIK